MLNPETEYLPNIKISKLRSELKYLTNNFELQIFEIGSSIFYILLPMETANPIIPNYSDGVKITDWDVRLQAYPYDYCTTKGAHYRTFGADQKFHFTKTTTHEALEQGITPKNKKGDDDTTRVTRRPMINFTSFPVIDTEKRFAATMKEATDCSPYRSDNKAKMYMTTYKRSYIDHRPRPIKEPEVIPDIQDVYPLFNRISKSDFEVIGPMAPRKFMDDHLMHPSPQKQLSNHYKQIRMVSYCPWLGTYK
ncbi:uncharacterized protein LOC119652462 [Hermetia illucens]|uniref:uncharacterized protein LOC119652462 n=1 Tax=Hermetia illucens TaxID=343691 RepID=UPI0018CC04C5|nr:uncharacterized protein LOC119652462 [Hermetia illucens]